MGVANAIRGWDVLGPILAGERVDVPAIAFWKHHPVADQDGRSLAEATLAFQWRVDCDLVKLTPASSYQLVDYGLRDEWIPDGVGRRTVTHRPVVEPEDWLRLAERRPGGGFTAEMLGCALRVRRALPRDIPIIATIFNPIFQAVTLAGMERFLEHIEASPVEVSQGLTTITANTIALIEAFRGEGVDGFYLASQHASQAAMTRRIYCRWGAPGDKACVGAMHSSLSIMHLHGEGVPIDACPTDARVLHYDATLPGNLAVSDTIRRFAGVVSSKAPPEGLPERRFIVSSGCTVPLDVSDDELAGLVAKYRRA
jgi:uroporphyrinogen decarboxylase